MPKLAFTYECPVEITSDTKWQYAATARPMYGLHDYERTISFVRPLKDYELKRLVDVMVVVDNPGYCNWSVRKTLDTPLLATYKFFTTCDSSD